MRYEGESDDETMARRALTGEREAFAGLLRRHYASALGLCRRILGHEGLAEDVA